MKQIGFLAQNQINSCKMSHKIRYTTEKNKQKQAVIYDNCNKKANF